MLSQVSILCVFFSQLVWSENVTNLSELRQAAGSSSMKIEKSSRYREFAYTHILTADKLGSKFWNRSLTFSRMTKQKKIDGTHAVIFCETDNSIKFCSRKHVLQEGHDNLAFSSTMLADTNIVKLKRFFTDNPDHVLYGEFDYNKILSLIHI